ncbi:hypothetical protein [Streptomyces roseus]|uniref:IrrE N-terminal-like domain-containing protein n=1 Tax=Streptomyces roseus TaxID=66430 RepID=A0A0J6XSK2_9ACTN|nr:hypothetical protein [Streptomyces roseus]KMO97743.1 hypothetical protein ACS04_11275 [Streptomyces roseus]
MFPKPHVKPGFRAAAPESDRRARRLSRRFVKGLDLPPAADVRELIPAIQRISGHPTRLAPAPAGSFQGICGMWIRTAAGIDYIFVHENTSRVHQDHIIAHEIGHIIRGHGLTRGLATDPGAGTGGGSGTGSGTGTGTGAGAARQQQSTADQLDRLVPHLDPAKVRVMLGRTDYAHEEEREAELIGTHLQHLLHRPARGRTTRQDRAARTLLRGWR